MVGRRRIFKATQVNLLNPIQTPGVSPFPFQSERLRDVG